MPLCAAGKKRTEDSNPPVEPNTSAWFGLEGSVKTDWEVGSSASLDEETETVFSLKPCRSVTNQRNSCLNPTESIREENLQFHINGCVFLQSSQ